MAAFFQRWYDSDVQLSELVHSMESLSLESQVFFAFLVETFSDKIVKVRGKQFFSEMDWDTLKGVYKSKRRGRRWYDSEPNLQRAFNKLYSLSADDKAAVARELHIPSRLVMRYESECHISAESPPNIDLLCQIVETSFKEGPEKAQERFKTFDCSASGA